jgi:hypothetical protein
MLTKSKIITLAVLASLGLLMAAPAEAKSNVDFNVGIGIGVGGFYPGGYGGYYGGYYEPTYYGVSCGEARSIVKGNGFYKVKAIDCSAPSYKFIAWQGGNKYKVRVNAAGNITGVNPL